MVMQTETRNNWIELFKARAEAVGAKVYRAQDIPGAARLISEIARAKQQESLAVSTAQFAAQEESWQTLVKELETGLRIETREGANQIAGAQIGLSMADLGVVETGSLVFAQNDLNNRLIAMLTFVHIAVIEAGKLVENLDRVGEKLQGWQGAKGDRRYVSMVTGPSRTADIERVLTIGVQGPQELHIVIVG